MAEGDCCTIDVTRMRCKVCGDKAHGCQYGVFSCEDCERLFERCFVQNNAYKPCNRGQRCTVRWTNARRCQSCVLHKCIEVGMSQGATERDNGPQGEDTLTSTLEVGVDDLENLNSVAQKPKEDAPALGTEKELPTTEKVRDPSQEELEILLANEKREVSESGNPTDTGKIKRENQLTLDANNDVPNTKSPVLATETEAKSRIPATRKKERISYCENFELDDIEEETIYKSTNKNIKNTVSVGKVSISEQPTNTPKEKVSEAKTNKTARRPTTNTTKEKLLENSSEKKVKKSENANTPAYKRKLKKDKSKRKSKIPATEVSVVSEESGIPAGKLLENSSEKKVKQVKKSENANIPAYKRKYKKEKRKRKSKIPATEVSVASEESGIPAGQGKSKKPKRKRCRIQEETKKEKVHESEPEVSPNSEKTDIPTSIQKVNVSTNRNIDTLTAIENLSEPECEKPSEKAINGSCVEQTDILPSVKKSRKINSKCKIQKVIDNVNVPIYGMLDILPDLNNAPDLECEMSNITIKVENLSICNSEMPDTLTIVEKTDFPNSEKHEILADLEEINEPCTENPIIRTISNEDIVTCDISENVDDSEPKSIKLNTQKGKKRRTISSSKITRLSRNFKHKVTYILSPEDEIKLTASIQKAHEETFHFTMENIPIFFLRNPLRNSTSQHRCPLNTTPYVEGSKSVIECEVDLFRRFAPAVQGVIEFAERIPCFKCLSQCDQDVLLKAGVFEVLLVRLAHLAKLQDISFVFSPFIWTGLTEADGKSLYNYILAFLERLSNLCLSDVEVGLFCSIVLIAGDHPELRNTRDVLRTQNELIGVLKKSLRDSHADNPNVFSDLMKAIPELRVLNCLHSKRRIACEVKPNQIPGTVADVIGMITETYDKSSFKNGQKHSVCSDLENYLNSVDLKSGGGLSFSVYEF